MTKGTPAIASLASSKVVYTVHEYSSPGESTTYGEAVAAALGVEPGRLFKTLVAEVDGSPAVGIVPADGRLSLKELARAMGGKRAEMASPQLAARLTGYVVGGISPFGQRRRLPMVCDSSVLDHETILVSGGRRGLQVELAPADLLALTGARMAPIADRKR